MKGGALLTILWRYIYVKIHKHSPYTCYNLNVMFLKPYLGLCHTWLQAVPSPVGKLPENILQIDMCQNMQIPLVYMSILTSSFLVKLYFGLCHTCLCICLSIQSCSLYYVTPVFFWIVAPITLELCRICIFSFEALYASSSFVGWPESDQFLKPVGPGKLSLMIFAPLSVSDRSPKKHMCFEGGMEEGSFKGP